MKKKILIFLTSLFLSVSYSQYVITENYDGHKHGLAEINLVWFNNQLSMDMISPTVNLLGYENKPRSSRDLQKLNQLYVNLENFNRLFAFNKKAYCNFKELDIENKYFSFYMNEYEKEINNFFKEDGNNFSIMNRGISQNPQSLKRMNNQTRPPKPKEVVKKPESTILPETKVFTPQSQDSNIEILGYYANNRINIEEFEKEDKRIFQNMRDKSQREGFNNTGIANQQTQTRFNNSPNSLNPANSFPRSSSSSIENQRPTPPVIKQEDNYFNQSQDVAMEDDMEYYDNEIDKYYDEEISHYDSDLSFRFYCPNYDHMNYVNFKGMFNVFDGIYKILVRVTSEDGQYYQEIDKNNPVVRLR